MMGLIEKPSYKIRELATRWQVGERTVYRLLNRSVLKFFKVGRSVRVTDEEVQKFESTVKGG